MLVQTRLAVNVRGPGNTHAHRERRIFVTVHVRERTRGAGDALAGLAAGRRQHLLTENPRVHLATPRQRFSRGRSCLL